MTQVIGECSKHPGNNFVDCTLCKIEEFQKNPPKIKVKMTPALRKAFNKMAEANPHLFKKNDKRSKT